MQTATATSDSDSDSEPIREAAQPGQSEEIINEKIRNAGYSPYPGSDAVSTALYRERLTAWLNTRAGIAFITEQDPTDEYVSVTFELPFGGHFSQEFARPDAAYQTDVSYPELVDATDSEFTDLSALRHEEVPLGRDSDGWCVDLSRPLAADPADAESHDPTQRSRTLRTAGLLAQRLLLIPLIAVIAVGLSAGSTRAGEALLLVAGFELLLFVFALAHPFETADDETTTG